MEEIGIVLIRIYMRW